MPRRDPALAADEGGFARVDGVCEGGQHVRTVQVPGPGGRGTGRGSQASGLPTRNPFPTPPPEKVAAQPRRVPQEHLQRFPEPSLPAGPRRQRAGGGGGPLRGRGAGEKLRLRHARTPCPCPARALTVGAVALPRAGHLRRAQAALGGHREVAQHVGGGEQVRRLHASRPTVCTVEAASSRGYCARRGGLGPERAPRKAMSALGPSPTALAAAAKARARMLRPGLPPWGGAARGPPPHSHSFRPPWEPAGPPPQCPRPPSHSAEEGRRQLA